MKKIILISLGILTSLSFFAAETKTYGVKYNTATENNEIWLIGDDGTETLMEAFKFPSGGWQTGSSYVDDKTGYLWLLDGNGTWVTYDPKTDTINLAAYVAPSGYQKTFINTFSFDEVIKDTLDENGNPITQIGTEQLVDESGDELISTGTDSDGSKTTIIGSNDIVGSDGDTLISKEADGSVHIGENSLVTVEENGVQQLYATDANDEMISINIKKGTDLLIDGVSVSNSLNTNATNIATNKTDIATNKTNIATNATNIATNTAEIATYTDSIAGNTTAIAALGSDLNTYKASTNSQINYMKSDYSSGIASAVAMSQFNLAQDGFSIGIGRGSYNDEDETAFGLGYGGEFKNGTLFKLQASKSGDASGVGLTVSF